MSDQQPAVTVRAIQPGDYQQWLPLWLAYQDFYQVTLSEEVSRRTFERFLDSREPMYSAVAVQDDEVIGFVNLVLHRSTWAVGDFCYLEDLYVAPSIRGSGAGKLLIECRPLPGNTSALVCTGIPRRATSGRNGCMTGWRTSRG